MQLTGYMCVCVHGCVFKYLMFGRILQVGGQLRKRRSAQFW